jgi:2-oxoglutarate dehydrogenase E2 component (dihydrolipoamide succinyltransferase)
MSVEIKVPVLPESVVNATIAAWYKKVGESVKRDENLVDIETDKVVLEVVAPQDGFLQEIIKTQGSTVVAEEVIAIVSSVSPATTENSTTTQAATTTATPAPIEEETIHEDPITNTENIAKDLASQEIDTTTGVELPQPGPGARRILTENGLNAEDVLGTGKDGRITKEDVAKVIDKPLEATVNEQSTLNVVAMPTVPDTIPSLPTAPIVTSIAPTMDVAIDTNSQREQKRVPMSRLRATIAQRLLAAQHNSAILTTFNEINMQPVMDLRTKYKEAFEKKNSVKLGFMSFFVKAVIEGLKRFPAINAAIDGNDIVYNGFFDIGIAVSSERGLLVPIIRDADLLSMAEIELKIVDFGKRAQAGKITIDDMTGGTFTISNGGVFGSLMSTPIINPPQSAILGMHKIEERPVVIDNQIVIRPMMYVALSYDHRIIDGAESVQFLVTVKEILEDPARFLLNV